MRHLAASILVAALLASAHASDWTQWRGPNRDNVWTETGILQTFPAGGLKVLWRAPAGQGYGTPIVAQGRVYITYSESSKSGVHECVDCLDETTGARLWQHRYLADYPEYAFVPNCEMGPNGTPIFEDGKLYTIGNVGNCFCLDAASGAVLWQRELQKEYPSYELCCAPSPMIEGELLIVDAGAMPGACLIAMDKRTGKDVWKALEGGRVYSSPMIITYGGQRQIVLWTRAVIAGVEPATGKVLWQLRIDASRDSVVSTPVFHDDQLLISGMMLKLDKEKPGAVKVWPESNAPAKWIISNTSTAWFAGAQVYTVRNAGKLVCLDSKSGAQLWETDKVTDAVNGASVHIVSHGDSALLFNNKGELIRAKLAPEGYTEISRVLVQPGSTIFSGHACAWAAPAFANKKIFARNCKEVLCASLAADEK